MDKNGLVINHYLSEIGVPGVKHCRPEPGIKRYLKKHTGFCLIHMVNFVLTLTLRHRSICVKFFSFSPSHSRRSVKTHQREGVDGVVHGALAWHRAPIAQQHEKASQAVKQRGQGGSWLLKTQEAREWPLRETKYITLRSV